MEIWSRDENRRHWCLDYIGEPKYEYITVWGEDGSRHDVPREVFKSPELKNKVKELETENEKLKKELDETKKELEEAKKGNSHEVGRVHLKLILKPVFEFEEDILSGKLAALGLNKTEVEDAMNKLHEEIEESELVANINSEELAKMVIKIAKKGERAHGFC